MNDRLSPKGCFQGHVTSLSFGKESDNISEMVQDREMVATGSLIGNHMSPIEWHHCQCP